MRKQNNSKFNGTFKKLAIVVLAAVFFGVGIGISNTQGGSAIAATSYEHLRTFAEVLSLIQRHYVEEKSPEELSKGAINGLLRTLDPHSSFMDKETYQNRKEETEGKFGGLGIEITVRDSFITIVTPIDDTPAEKAGLMAGDKIIKINGISTKDMNLMDAVKKLRGKIGTDVTITIHREEAGKPFDVTITRAEIKIKSVKYKMMENGMGYLRILSFSQATTREAKAAMREFKKQEMNGLVLDLRNNPGGLLKQSVDMSDLFLSGGKVIVSTRGRTDDQNSKFMSNSAGSYTDFPIVVLINAGSASASEIVAGALQDLNRAIVVGTQSFGKGSVQTIRQLSDGAGLSLTTARYYTPSGKMIHGIGIKPDIEIEFEKPKEKNEDDIKPMREKELMRNFNGLPEKTEKPEKDSKKEKDLPGRRKIYDLEKDNQLRRAVEVLKTWEIFKAIGLKKAS